MGARVPTHIVKARSREMSALFNSYLTWTALVGREVDVLVTDVSSDGRYVVAHTRGYAQFLLPPEWPRLRKPAKQRAAGGDGERDGDAPACAPAESPLMGCRVLARILSAAAVGSAGSGGARSAGGEAEATCPGGLSGTSPSDSPSETPQDAPCG